MAYILAGAHRRFYRVKRSPINVSRWAFLYFDPKFSNRRFVDATIVISLACPTDQGQKGQPNRSLENRSWYSAPTSIRYGEKHVQDTFVAKQLGYSGETSTPISIAFPGCGCGFTLVVESWMGV